MNEQYTSQVLDHLGIVAGVCQQIGLIEQIDARVPETGRTVSVGQAIQAMVVNGLGFVGRPLYLTPEFYANKPVDLLIGEGIEAAILLRTVWAKRWIMSMKRGSPNCSRV